MARPTTLVPAVDVQVRTQGTVTPEETAYARRRLEAVLRYARDPVLHVRAKLTRLADPAVERPVVAQANLDYDGRLLRVQAARPTATEAVDEVHDRLRDRLQRASADWQAIRGGRPVDEAHEWRHLGVPAERPAFFPRPVEGRQVVRHKAFGLARATVDEAAFDMAMLDYGFHLFVEDGSGTDSVLYRTDDGRYRLVQLDPHPRRVTVGLTPVTVSARRAPRIGVEQAAQQLDLAGRPFVFFRDATTGRGCLLYHRYDGHYGLITPAG